MAHVCHGCSECKRREELYNQLVAQAPSISSLKTLWRKIKRFFRKKATYQIVILNKEKVAFLYLNKKPIHRVEGEELIEKTLKLINYCSSLNIQIINKN